MKLLGFLCVSAAPLLLATCQSTAEPAEDWILLGSVEGEAATNGIAFATEEATVADLTRQTVTLLPIMQIHDCDSETVSLTVSNIPFEVGEDSFWRLDGTMTIGDLVSTIEDGVAIDETGQTWWTYK